MLVLFVANPVLAASVCGNWQAPPAVGYSQLVVGNFEHLHFMGGTHMYTKDFFCSFVLLYKMTKRTETSRLEKEPTNFSIANKYSVYFLWRNVTRPLTCSSLLVRTG